MPIGQNTTYFAPLKPKPHKKKKTLRHLKRMPKVSLPLLFAAGKPSEFFAEMSMLPRGITPFRLTIFYHAYI